MLLGQKYLEEELLAAASLDFSLPLKLTIAWQHLQ